MRYVIQGTLLLLAVIHLLPAYGVLGSSSLARLYGVVIGEPNLEILMRHRALLFGLIGGFCVVAAFKPELQTSAFVFAWLSVVSFLALAWSTAAYNAQLARVVAVDLVALACLVVGTAALVVVGR